MYFTANGYQKNPHNVLLRFRNWQLYFQSFILTGKRVVMLYLYKQVL